MDGYDNMVGLRKFFIGLMFIGLVLFVVQAVPPSVEFINPNDTSLPISGTIKLEANATDIDGNISIVEFYHNGNGGSVWKPIGNSTIPDYGSNYCFDWDTTKVVDGIGYVFLVRAIDNNSEKKEDEIGGPGAYITIDNNNNQPPTVSLNSPTSGSTVNKTITLNATAKDINGTILNVNFEFNNGSGWSPIEQNPLNNGDYYYRDWNTELVDNGSYEIRVTATDNSTEDNHSITSNINVNNPLNINPIVTLNNPPGNNTNGTIILNATATDSEDGHITEVFFEYSTGSGWSPIGPHTSNNGDNYLRDWNTSSVSNGVNYQIRATATDNRTGADSNTSDVFSIYNNQGPSLTNNTVIPEDGTSPVTFYFYVTYTDNELADYVKVFVDGELRTMYEVDTSDQTTSDGKKYEYNITLTNEKSYNCYFEASDGTTTSKIDSVPKTITVNSATYTSGNRIWDEKKNLSDEYTWTPRSFSGFYYNLDTDEGKEKLTIKNIGRSIDDDDIEYITKPIVKEFECNNFGKYSVIGFMAERYFAGYKENSIINDGFSLLDEEILSRVLVDDDESQMIKSGIPLVLEEGYEFRVTEYAASGDDVMVALFKDGESIHETILSEGSTFTYKKDLGSAEDIPIIAIHVDTVFRGMETSTINIDGIFQISDNYINVEDGDRFGLMEIKTVNSDEITMVNSNDVSLKEGKTFNLMGKINIEVGDCATLRFALTVDTSEPGTYELRGTVTEDIEYTWTPLNFEGLLYDIDSGDEEETLNIKRDDIDERKIDPGDLSYTTSPISMNFEYGEWDEYESIGFMGEKYFAGYKASSIVTKSVSLMDKGYLGKILIDEDEKHTLYVGNSLPLADGYSFRIDEISQDGDSIMVALLRDGEEIRSDIINDESTYTYTKEIDDEDIPMIAIHIDKIFRGMETNSIFVNGIFQISEDFKKVEEGDSYGNMEIDDVGEDKIIMTNDGSITLGTGDTISIMGDIKIKVADNSTVRFYPFQEIKVESLEYLEVDFPDNIYSNQEFTIRVTSDGDEVEDAYVSFGDIEIGSTDSNGELVYTPTETGSFTIIASKSGYNSDSSEIEVIFQPKALDISFPLVVDKNELLTISVTSEGSPVSGASVMFGSIDLGTTPSSGSITHTPDEIGTFTITASKTGYQDVSKDIDISDPSAKLVFSNLTIDPEEVEPGQIVTISVETANFGTLREAETVILNINQEEESSRDVTLGPGEITTLTFTVNKSKPGTYDVEIGGRKDSFKVTGDSSISIIAMILLGIIGIFSAGAIIYSISQGNLTLDSMTVKANEIEQKIRRLIEK